MVARESPSKTAERRGRNERMILGEGFEKNVSSKKARERDFFYTFLESAIVILAVRRPMLTRDSRARR